jgi:hypothetical protein
MKNSTGQARPTIIPDFSHRLQNNDTDIHGLVDSITDMTLQARGILAAIMFSHQGKTAHITPIDTANAAYAAINLLNDVDAYLKAVSDSQAQ